MRDDHGRNLTGEHGFTLAELLVTIAIFVALVALTTYLLRGTLRMWRAAERRRAVEEKGEGALALLAEDLRQALTRDSLIAGDRVRVAMLADVDTATGMQKIFFVRAFERGPERTLTFAAADGLVDDGLLVPAKEDETKAGPLPPDKKKKKPDTEFFTGGAGDLKAPAGMAQVGWFVLDGTLMRAVRAPAVGALNTLETAGFARPVAKDVLYLGFEFWGGRERGSSLTVPLPGKGRRTLRIWDSTRGLFRFFPYYRGRGSVNDPRDDVFPRLIRVTLTVDIPLPRCVHTQLTEPMAVEDMVAKVESTRGFPEGGTDRSYILIAGEWMHYSDLKSEKFIIDRRGARGTVAKDISEEEVVRTGVTFQRVVYLPNHRESPFP